MFLKSCKGRKSCLDPIPRLFINFENLQHHFFCIFIIDHRLQPATIPLFLQRFHHHRFSCFHDVVEKIMTDNESKTLMEITPSAVFSKTPKSPKTDHPKKVDFGSFRPSLYRPIRTGFRDGAKMVIFEGSRPQNRKKALFCKKT